MSRATPEVQQLRREFTELKRRLAKTGYLCTGSLMSLYHRCGKPYCACHRDRNALHGPYSVWTRKVQGKTVTRTLTARQAEQCRRCIENMREVERILERMKELSATYIESQR